MRTLFLAFNNPAGDEEEYNRWYDEVHVPAVLQLDGFVSARRFRLSDARPPTDPLSAYRSSRCTSLTPMTSRMRSGDYGRPAMPGLPEPWRTSWRPTLCSCPRLTCWSDQTFPSVHRAKEHESLRANIEVSLVDDAMAGLAASDGTGRRPSDRAVGAHSRAIRRTPAQEGSWLIAQCTTGRPGALDVNPYASLSEMTGAAAFRAADAESCIAGTAVPRVDGETAMGWAHESGAKQ